MGLNGICVYLFIYLSIYLSICRFIHTTCFIQKGRWISLYITLPLFCDIFCHSPLSHCLSTADFSYWHGLADLDGVLYCGVGGAALADGYLASWLVFLVLGVEGCCGGVELRRICGCCRLLRTATPVFVWAGLFGDRLGSLFAYFLTEMRTPSLSLVYFHWLGWVWRLFLDAERRRHVGYLRSIGLSVIAALRLSASHYRQSPRSLLTSWYLIVNNGKKKLVHAMPTPCKYIGVQKTSGASQEETSVKRNFSSYTSVIPCILSSVKRKVSGVSSISPFQFLYDQLL